MISRTGPCSRSPFLGLEFQRGAVHAVAKAGRRWTVRKEMPEVSAALRAVHFGARHGIAAVLGSADRRIERTPEAWPSGSALELRIRREQRVAARSAGEPPRPLLLIERAGAGTLGPMLTQHLILAGRQRLLPFLVRLVDREIELLHKLILLWIERRGRAARGTAPRTATPCWRIRRAAETTARKAERTSSRAGEPRMSRGLRGERQGALLSGGFDAAVPPRAPGGGGGRGWGGGGGDGRFAHGGSRGPPKRTRHLPPHGGGGGGGWLVSPAA